MATATILPEPRFTAFDQLGNPLAGGIVHSYVPGGTTPSPTWQDAARAIPNSNPIILDADGSCLLYGAGNYQLTVTDSTGVSIPAYSGISSDGGLNNLVANAILNTGGTITGPLAINGAASTTRALSFETGGVLRWNVLTSGEPETGSNAGSNFFVARYDDTGAFISSPLEIVRSTGMAIFVNGLTSNSVAVTSSPSISYAPTANPPTTLASLNVQATTTAGTSRQFLGSFGLTSNSGHGTVGADKVALYAATDGVAGSSDIWAFNTVTTMESTFPSDSNAQGYELDFNNLKQNLGDTPLGGGFAAPIAVGLSITGASTFRSTSAMIISGLAGKWNRGITIVNNATAQTSFEDLGNSITSIQIAGSHTYGINMTTAAVFSTAAIAIPNTANISWRDVAGTGFISDRVDASNNRIIGSGAANNMSAIHMVPSTDNVFSCGANGLRWSVVWASNGTIQTSDPSLKMNIAALPPAAPLIAAINPITFQWKVGGIEDGAERPGRRTHWGFDASNIKAAFDGIGMDFGGYVLGDDGTQNLRPDQLIPVLWKAVQELTTRVAALEAPKP